MQINFNYSGNANSNIVIRKRRLGLSIPLVVSYIKVEILKCAFFLEPEVIFVQASNVLKNTKWEYVDNALYKNKQRKSQDKTITEFHILIVLFLLKVNVAKICLYSPGTSFSKIFQQICLKHKTFLFVNIRCIIAEHNNYGKSIIHIQ